MADRKVQMLFDDPRVGVTLDSVNAMLDYRCYSTFVLGLVSDVMNGDDLVSKNLGLKDDNMTFGQKAERALDSHLKRLRTMTTSHLMTVDQALQAVYTQLKDMDLEEEAKAVELFQWKAAAHLLREERA